MSSSRVKVKRNRKTGIREGINRKSKELNKEKGINNSSVSRAPQFYSKYTKKSRTPTISLLMNKNKLSFLMEI